MHKKQWAFVLSLALGNMVAGDALSQSSSEAISSNAPIHSLKNSVSSALEEFEQTRRENWSYKLSRYENEEGDVTSSIETFTPHPDAFKRWSLLMINGQKPSEKQLSAFIESKLENSSDKATHFRLKLRELIDVDGLELEAENELTALATFPVSLPKLGDDASEKLQGRLTYNKQEQFIEQIEVTNKSTFSPMFSAKITDFKLTITFDKIDSYILPLQNKLSMKGTFAFFTDIDEKSLDTFSEYRFIAP